MNGQVVSLCFDGIGPQQLSDEQYDALYEYFERRAAQLLLTNNYKTVPQLVSICLDIIGPLNLSDEQFDAMYERLEKGATEIFS